MDVMPKVKEKPTPAIKSASRAAPPSFDETYADYLATVERGIAANVLAKDKSIVGQAAKYSLMAGGKRVRPVMLLNMAGQNGKSKENPIFAALAIEMIHTFSLMHDDLPCIDNATLRRGRECAHRVYGEAAGLLAGDLLLNEAYYVLSQNYSNALAGRLTKSLSQACFGVVEGEWADVLAETQKIQEVDIDFIYLNKTGRMIGVPVEMGLILAGWSDAKIKPFTTAAEEVGIAFQIVDDLLDITSDAATLGKDVDQDERKKTYYKRYGEAWCRKEVAKLSESAKKVFKKLPRPEFILELTERLVHRDK